MKLIDILSVITDNTKVSVLDLEREVKATYDGKDSIPVQMNNIEVYQVFVEDNSLQIIIKE